jgi:hypothetical protein
MATRPQVAAIPTAEIDTRSYLDWGAVIAGAVIAAAISLILLTFGSAIGLSMASPYEGEGASKALFAIALGIWVLWVIVSSNLAGGYVAGRMRRRIGDASEQESDVRDGVHGLAMWGLGVLVAALLTLAGISGLTLGGAKLAGAIASSGAGGQSRTDALGYTVDSLFRSTGPTSDGNVESAKREVTRILAMGTAGRPIADEDKAYVGRLVAARTGLTQPDAQRRVADALAKMKRTADLARKTGIVSGFLLAAALLAGGAAACWSAIMGGRHRDDGTAFALWR